jgi:ring-1,2-phenylacetyl-CoA epoxidase subunit PaaD
MDAAYLPGVGVVRIATDVRAAVASVVDPEIPVLTIEDLGILRSVEERDGRVTVTITPTYSGCPAMRQIEDDIASMLMREGIEDFEIVVSHHPGWTTDWMSEEGHRKLAEFGIAPPTGVEEVLCPRCSADRPETISSFGSTACKALMVCSVCREPFDYFKRY